MVKGRNRRRNKAYGSFERDEPFESIRVDYMKWRNGAHMMFVLDYRSRPMIGYSISGTRSAEETINILEETFGFWRIHRN